MFSDTPISNHESSQMKALQSPSNVIEFKLDRELMILHQWIKRTYVALSVDKDVGAKVKTFLKVLSNHESNPVYLPTTMNDAQERLSNLFNIDCLIDDKTFHIPFKS